MLGSEDIGLRMLDSKFKQPIVNRHGEESFVHGPASIPSSIIHCTHLLSLFPVLVHTLSRVISTLITPIVKPANRPVSKISTIANRPAANHAGPVSLTGPGEGAAVAAEREAVAGSARSGVSRRTSELILFGGPSKAASITIARWLMGCAEQKKSERMDKPSGAVKFCKHVSAARTPASASAEVTVPGGRGYERAETRSSKKAAILMAMLRGHER